MDSFDWPDEMGDVWDQAQDVFGDNEQFDEFIEQAENMFHEAYVAAGYSTEERQNMRDEFFDFMFENDISIDVFDWDSWRDWYENAG